MRRGWGILKGDQLVLVSSISRESAINCFLIQEGGNCLGDLDYPEDEEARDDWAALWAQGARCIPLAMYEIGDDERGPHAPVRYWDKKDEEGGA